MVTPNEGVFLDIEQVAKVCCVSPTRVHRWVETRGLRVKRQGACLSVNSSDLIDFLVQYNMPIPETILPTWSKKILFVFASETLEIIYVKFLIKFFRKLKEDANFVCDYAPYGKEAEYKAMTFAPDLLVTDTISAYSEAIKLNRHFKEMGGAKILSIVDKGMGKEDVHRVRFSGADAVVPRSIEINILVEQCHALFQ